MSTAIVNSNKVIFAGVSDQFSARFNVGPGIYYDATAAQIGANPFTNDAAISLTDGTYSASVVGMKSAGNGIVMHTGSSGFYTEPKTAWYFLITANTAINVPASAGGTMTIVGPVQGGFDNALVTLNSGADELFVESGNWFNLVAVPNLDNYSWMVTQSGAAYWRPNS